MARSRAARSRKIASKLAFTGSDCPRDLGDEGRQRAAVLGLLRCRGLGNVRRSPRPTRGPPPLRALVTRAPASAAAGASASARSFLGPEVGVKPYGGEPRFLHHLVHARGVIPQTGKTLPAAWRILGRVCSL